MSISVLRREDEEEADDHQQQLGQEVDHGQQDVDAGRLLDAHHVDQAEDDDDADAEEDVGRAVAQRVDADDAAEVVRHEERRDGDRDRVVEHLRPGGEEGRELVEGAAGERRRAARLGVHRGGLGVGGRRQIEDEAGDDEDDRRQAERERRDEAERVVDRRADVAVGGREEGVDPQHPLEAVQAAFGHAVRGSLGVEGVDLAGVLLGDRAALELHRRRELVAARQPLGRRGARKRLICSTRDRCALAASTSACTRATTSGSAGSRPAAVSGSRTSSATL